MYKIGFWESDITPALGAGIPGYGELRFGTGVKDKLYTKAVAIECSDECIIMVSIDSCEYAKNVYDAIRDRIIEKTGLESKNIMICVTHTHTGGPDKDTPADGNDVELDKTCLDYAIKVSADAAILAYNRREEAVLKYACGEVRGISFVRNYHMQDGSIRTNPGRCNPEIVKPYSEPDYSLPVLFAFDKNGSIMGAIYDYACHQDCVDGTEYSGDYSSIVSKVLKEKYGTDFVSVYFSGTAGNINHFDVSKKSDSPDHYVMMGQVIAKELSKLVKIAETIPEGIKLEKVEYTVSTRLPSDEEMAEYERIARETVVPEGAKIAADSPKYLYDYMMATRNIAMSKTTPKDFPIVVQVVKLGDVKIYALQGEVFAQYAERIRKETGYDKNMFFTLANSSWMYVPIPELYGTLIYEADYGSAMIYGKDAMAMCDKAIEISKSL